ncbi:nitric-oxide reductase large subunit [Pseudomarimonas salicorniae]|uniref:Nitric-oxide reductase large subunit n=1 Tax=Pseudomarimonas salicorniae TaxID=2933270 RepID=A0ABT0GE14_9GAMM|nr:nitric-oxide reductase large subunit [Lysobacter sp. CAU 1642]MCK7592678.1 nitric-oxide reductase large subunit [Lysobacter sp. CAU 1642]
MSNTKKLWLMLGGLLFCSFSVLLWMGSEIYRQAPPVPGAFVAEDGSVLYSRDDIQTGREVWQSMGGMQLGSIWGHGAYVAPDWSADWLNREAKALLGIWSRQAFQRDFHLLDPAQQAGLKDRLQREMRRNTFDTASERVVLSNDRVAAAREVAEHYDALFGSDPALRELRENYAMKEATVGDPERRAKLAAFIHWAAWAAATERPGQDITYTSNWPSEPLVGNQPTSGIFLWTVFSVLFLIAGIAALVWYHAARGEEPEPGPPSGDPLAGLVVTPSMRATAKYFWLVVVLFLVQIALGATTAHYQVEGQTLYGFDLAEILPYSLVRTWHTQLSVLWIATAWLATGLFIAPAIGGREPAWQRFGVNFLFTSLLIIVVGAFAGQWFAVMQIMPLDMNFWFGHQGWEYVDLGRFWQIYLFVGLMLWLLLVGRGLWPAIQRRDENRSIVLLLFLSTVAIGLFYAAGLMWGRHTHISMVEYWRWWVVHLWVEGFFEVFATAVIAFLFTRLGLVRARIATAGVLFATVIFLTGGVLGTAHHWYWAGTPTSVLAIGASFSALEVVPLALIGFEALHTYRGASAAPWMPRYRWPILFFVAVAFWNLVGAGLFGFLINPPLALYYMQGLNLTPLHGHTALFGVYGMLGIGLMLFCLRLMRPAVSWDSVLLKRGFWSLNIGLAAMALMCLLPIGILQLAAAIDNGYAYARSAEFMQQPIIETLVWMRVPGDVIFAVGACFIGVFVARLWIGARQVDVPAKGAGQELN